MYRTATGVVPRRASLAPRICRRYASTEAESDSSPSSAHQYGQFYDHLSPEKKFEFEAGRVPGTFSGRVRLWEFAHSMSDAMHVIKEIEKQYGPLQEFKFDKDKNSQSRYQIFIRVRFSNPESVQWLAGDPVIHIPLPKEVPARPGGISLEDLEDVFLPTKFDPEARFQQDIIPPPSERMIDGKLVRSLTETFTLGSYNFNARLNPHVAKNFLAFGGFSKMKPIKAGTEILPDKVDHPLMRLSLRKWAEASGILNPYETSGDVPAPTKEDEWVDLEEKEGKEAVASDATSPSAASSASTVARPSAPPLSTTPSPPPPSPRPAQQRKPKAAKVNVAVQLPQPSAATRKLKPQTISSKPSQTELEKQMMLAKRNAEKLEAAKKEVPKPETTEKVVEVKKEVPVKETKEEEKPAPPPSSALNAAPTPEEKKAGIVGRLRNFVGW